MRGMESTHSLRAVEPEPEAPRIEDQRENELCAIQCRGGIHCNQSKKQRLNASAPARDLSILIETLKFTIRRYRDIFRYQAEVLRKQNLALIFHSVTIPEPISESLLHSIIIAFNYIAPCIKDRDW